MIDVSNGVPGVNAPDPTTYEEFWPYYVSQHLHPATRAAHVGGTTLGIAIGAVGIVRAEPWFFVPAAVVGYGFAWASHFLIEKNKPASWGKPWWSFRADFRQLRKFFTGKLERDVQTVRAALDLKPQQRTLAEVDKDRLAA